MSDVREMTCRPRQVRTLWCFVALGAAGACLAAASPALGLPGAWAGLGLLLAVVGLAALHWAVSRVTADARGLHVRTLLRRWSVPWREIADVRVQLRRAKYTSTRRVGVVLRNGRTRLLPLPYATAVSPEFDADLDAVRALHRRYGTPESDRVHVVSYRTAGRGWVWPAAVCALFLAASGLAAWFVPVTAAHAQAWRSATPCTASTPAAQRGDCLSTVRAVIARTDPHRPHKQSWLYFTDDRPVRRLAVSQGAAHAFEPGDRVELTVWRGEVREVAGRHHVWRRHVSGAGDVAAVAAGLALAAGFPAAHVHLRLRGRGQPDDEVLPSVLPFAVALVVTGGWLVPLCYRHPTSPPTAAEDLTWAVAGSLVTLALCVWAWHATRIRRPGEAGKPAAAEDDGEVFLAARFLDATDYNPYGDFGTHVVLGGGEPPAVLPHGGPGRFAERRIPAERLTVRAVRRPRGGDGESVPRSWHVADLDDAGTPVRLTAAPADLTRILRALNLTQSPTASPLPEH
jgi:hypothetical protein